MRLTSAHVREYKSIRDSNIFHIGEVTCLVGKNESGKTALLEALYRLNPIVDSDAKFDVTEDYPRAEVEDYRFAVEQKKRQPAKVVTATFALDVADMEHAEVAFGKGLFKTEAITVSRGYDDVLRHTLDLDESIAVRHLVADAGLPQDLTAEAESQRTLKDLLNLLEKRDAEQQRALADAEAKAAAIEDAQEKAAALDEANKLQESQASKQFRAKLATLTTQPLTTQVWNTYLAKRLPRFLYFDEYYQMEGQLNINRLKQRQANNQLSGSDRTMLALVELARLNLDQLLQPQNTQELVNRLEGASNHLSRKIFEYWSQNKHLSVKFDIRPGLPGDPEGMRDGMNLWGSVFDSGHQVTIRLGTRSRGFIWFFSFLAWFSQQRKAVFPIILLLDEPGLFLHASAQADLLRYIEKELKPHHQVIFTSHSPFMVDPRHFDRVRIVRDRSMEDRSDAEPLPPEMQGTKILSDVLEADENSLFPLQGALAYDITQTLFVGPNIVIVEGVSDLLYIETISDVLEGSKRERLSDKWTISPVGGSDKVPTFVALFRSQKGLNLATLIDIQKKDHQKIENIYRQRLLQKRQVLTFADFTSKSEADIEDMFDDDFYLALVNAEYKKDLGKPIAVADLKSQHPRMLVRLAEYFEQNPLSGGLKFNHYRPARYFAENIAGVETKLLPDTLDRFEAAFKALNALVA
jgi:predicted ATP-dependent endonuclease of OLD family